MPCRNRNGVWPPRYERNWAPHPARALPRTAQAEWQRCVLDAVAAGELHRTTGTVLLAFSRASSSQLEDVWIAQATVAGQLGLAESTVCHHVTIAKRLGWLAVQHRNRIDHGLVLAMSNVTRFELPAHWQQRLDEQRQERRAAQTRARRDAKRSGPRATGSRAEPQRLVREDERSQAASVGAGLARSSGTETFEQGVGELEETFAGRAELYLVAYDSFTETWKTVRQNK
ncbi:MAG: hypothetical protein ACK5OX_07705 [Desertimonas sp.]